MIVKCSFCGKQKIVDTELYGTPLVHCDSCKKLFYDNKIKEPALNPPPINEREKLSFFIYLGVFFGLGFTIFSLSGVFTEGTDYLLFLIFGLVWTAGSVLLIWSTYRDKNKRNEHYLKLLRDSQQRLSSVDYQEQLIVASNGNADVVSLLRKYNLSNNLDFILDVDSIIHKYELLNETVDTNENNEQVESDNIAEQNDTKEIPNIDMSIKLFCRKCGTELLVDSDFCHRCGEKVIIK